MTKFLIQSLRDRAIRLIPGGSSRRALLVLALCVVAGLASQAPAEAVLRDVPGPSVRTDGRVYAILRSGDTIYLGGNFQNVDGERRTRLAAIDATTGDLKAWSPGASAAVHALAASPDGSRIYAGGAFTRVDGSDHAGVAAIDAVTGRDDTSWDVAVTGKVFSLSVLNDRLFVGGNFRAVDGQSRDDLVALDPAGGIVAGWKVGTNGTVLDTKIRGSRLYVGGRFSSIGGRPQRNLAAVGVGTGGRTTFRPKTDRPVIDLAVADSGVFAAQGGPWGVVASYGLVKGKRNWARETRGDSQAVAVAGGRVFVGGHFYRAAGVQRDRIAAFSARSGKLNRRWAPRLDEGVWEITPDVAAGRLYIGGDFERIGRQRQPGFARFSL